MIRPEIRDMPSDTPIATLMSKFLFDGGSCRSTDAVTTDETQADVLSAGLLDRIDETSVVVMTVAVTVNVAKDENERVLRALTAERVEPKTMGLSLISNARSQQPAAATSLPGVSLQQNVGVYEPLMIWHGIRLLKIFRATITLSKVGHV